jgi:biopolymer transport protein ExbB/TolQ
MTLATELFRAPMVATAEAAEGGQFSVQAMMEALSAPVIIVLLILAIMLFWCIYVAVERTLFLHKAQQQSVALHEATAPHFKKKDGAAALAAANQEAFSDSYLGHVLVPSLSEWVQRPNRHGIGAAERAIETVIVTEGEDLRRGLNILATTGATAPFVGLVGTIFGIINAFQMMEKEGATISDLAPAIGEALITTAIGIIVAIIGVWLFNFFTARIEAVTNKMSVTAQVFIDWCEKELIPSEDGDA